jgi:hypothetical protein
MVSLRVSTFLWMNDVRLKDLLDLLAEYRDTVGEVAFFTGFTHPPMPLATIQERAERLKRVIPEFKALGLSSGINHLSTMGHLDENLENSLNEPWQHLVDIGGGVSKSCYCVADPDMQEYVRRSYVALAEAGPDFIWVDDDVRMESHAAAIRFACFCDRCVAQFSTEIGRKWTREGLKEAFSSGELAERLALRRKWLEHNRAYIERLLKLIRSVVDTVDPKMRLGLMTGETAYSGFGNRQWAEALAGPNGVEVKWRPGGGFYEDSTPSGLLGKAHSTGRQTALLPASVTDVQYEHENFPYQPLRKSVTLFTAEIAAAIGAGCTGVALNLMGISQDPFDEYRPYFAAVRERKTFTEQAAGLFGRSPCEGLWITFTKDYFAALSASGDWTSASTWGGGFGRFNELAEIGLPMAYSREGASIVWLTAEACLEFSRDDLLHFLSGGVLLDGPALAKLNELGLSNHTGFAVRGTKQVDTIERLTNDEINGRFGGWHRDCRPSFWPETTYLLEPRNLKSRILSEVIDFTPTSFGPCSGVFENSLGGRVAVLGYYPTRFLQSLAKSSQMKALCRWLSRDRLPAYVDSYSRVALWCRRDAQGRPALMVLNASIDPVERLVVRVRTAAGSAHLIREDGLEQIVQLEDPDGGYRTVHIEGLGTWEPVLFRTWD